MGVAMLDILTAILTFLAVIRFVNHREALSKNAKCVWLFKAFVSILFSAFILSFVWPQYKSPVMLFSALPLTAYYLFNFRRIYISIFLAGLLANSATITTNGYMPVSKEAVTRMGGSPYPVDKDGKLIIAQGKKTTYKYINDETIWPFLGDIIYFPGAGAVFSVGDCLSLVALLIFLLTLKKNTAYKNPP